MFDGKKNIIKKFTHWFIGFLRNISNKIQGQEMYLRKKSTNVIFFFSGQSSVECFPESPRHIHHVPLLSHRYNLPHGRY